MSYSLFIGNLSRFPSILISEEDIPLFFLKSFKPYSHQENLILMLDKLLNLVNAHIQEIEQIVLYSGPGLFTSLRIGFAFAKAFYLKKPDYRLYTINSLDALASQSCESLLIPCLPAQKEEHFFALYEEKKRISDYSIGKKSEILEKFKNFKIEFYDDFPDAEILFKAYKTLKNTLQPQDPVLSEPFYLRLPDAYLKISGNNR
ncbi:MAG: tRNA (adenosine(37)-N6)-threonylcarbamoyltransferase complex dimerization subunit type 1 TsaB [candidate division WOR-3 bacterium]